MNEFKDQIDKAEQEKVSALIAELRELAVKGQAADPSIDAEAIRVKINETQQASLGLFQKVCLPFFLLSIILLITLCRCMRSAMLRTTLLSLHHQRSPRKIKRPHPVLLDLRSGH